MTVGFLNGTLDPNVSVASALPGPILPGITIDGVPIEIEDCTLRASSVSFSYTTIS